MTIELLKANIAREKELVREINIFSNQLRHIRELESQGRLVNKNEKRLLEKSVNSLSMQLKIINAAIPEILGNISFYKKLGKKKPAVKPKKLMQVSYSSPKVKKDIKVAIPKAQQTKFVESVSSEDQASKQLAKSKTIKSDLPKVKKPSLFIKYSNKFFREIANDLVKKGHFVSINKDLRKITSPIILTSFIAMMFFSTLLSFFIGLLIMVVFLLVGINILISIIIPLVFPLITFLLFFSYPGNQKNSLEKEINQELPFVTIYMSAIATSGIEPSKIFSIMVKTKDYPFTQREIKKLLNYINFYGYDLVSALKYVAKHNPSPRLAMLFNGMSTTITSGGRLTDFLDKHAETLLFDYRLEREKYTKIAETFMDIYISVVIAAPMIMMMLFVLLSLTGFGGGFLTPTMLSILIVFIVSTLNILFILFINMKQPKF